MNGREGSDSGEKGSQGRFSVAGIGTRAGRKSVTLSHDLRDYMWPKVITTFGRDLSHTFSREHLKFVGGAPVSGVPLSEGSVLHLMGMEGRGGVAFKRGDFWTIPHSDGGKQKV